VFHCWCWYVLCNPYNTTLVTQNDKKISKNQKISGSHSKPGQPLKNKHIVFKVKLFCIQMMTLQSYGSILK
jgi:hypothetical protein